MPPHQRSINERVNVKGTGTCPFEFIKLWISKTGNTHIRGNAWFSIEIWMHCKHQIEIISTSVHNFETIICTLHSLYVVRWNFNFYHQMASEKFFTIFWCLLLSAVRELVLLLNYMYANVCLRRKSQLKNLFSSKILWNSFLLHFSPFVLNRFD